MIVVVPLVARLLDPVEDRPDGVDEPEQDAGHLVVEVDLVVAQLPEEVFAAVRDRPELREPEESARPLDGVDGAEDARQPAGIARIGLEGDQVAVELIEILRRFDEELTDEFFVFAHATTRMARVEGRLPPDPYLTSGFRRFPPSAWGLIRR